LYLKVGVEEFSHHGGKSKIIVEKNSSKCTPTIPHNLSLCLCMLDFNISGIFIDNIKYNMIVLDENGLKSYCEVKM